MNFCEKCFNDEIIKKLIQRDGVIGNCSFCESNAIKVIPSEAQNLKDYFGGLLEVYTPIENIKDYQVSEGELLKTIIKNEWNIFSKDITSTSIEEILRKILPEKKDLYSKKVAIPNKKEYESISILKNYKWKDFTKEIKEVNRFHTEIFNKKSFEYFLMKLELDLESGKFLYRGRISTKKGYNKDKMGCPPIGKSSSGRINPEGISCLYLAEEKETILKEMRVLIKNFITIGKFELKNNIRIIDLTKLDKLSPFSDLEEIPIHAINQKILKEISIEISKPKSMESNSVDYLPSQYISEFIKKLGYSGIKYKSTVHNGGINYAIFREDDFVCKSVDIYEIKDVGFQYEIIEKE